MTVKKARGRRTSLATSGRKDREHVKGERGTNHPLVGTGTKDAALAPTIGSSPAGSSDQTQESAVDQNSARRVAILVLGMHRSGTSALTRVIAFLGADLPTKLMPPSRVGGENEKGYWESREIADLNDAILVSAGSNWHDWRRFNPSWVLSPVHAAFKARALELLQNDFAASSLFVLKDPRVCRLLPFWLNVIREFDADIRCVLPLRNPLEVAASLKKRNGFSPAKSLMLWLRYVLDAEYESRGLKRSFVTYSALLGDWRGTMRNLSDRIDIAWPRRSATSEVEIDDFLEHRLRNHEIGDEGISENPEIVSWVRNTFTALIAFQDEPDSADALAQLDATRAEFNRASDALGAVLRAEEMSREGLEESLAERNEQIAILDDRLAERNSQIAGLNQAVTESDGQISGLKDTLAERNGQITGLSQSLAERDGQIAGLNETLVERDGQIGGLSGTLAERDGQITELRERLTERDAQITGLNQAVMKLDAQVAGLNERLVERDAKITGLNQAVVERGGQVTGLNERLTERDAKIAGLNQAAAERDTKVTGLSKRLAERDAQIAGLSQARQELAYARSELVALKRSRSWRLMAPYRAVGTGVKRAVGAVVRTGVLLRPTVATLLLPAAFEYYGGPFKAIRAFRSGPGFFAKVVENQDVVRERLLKRGWLYRRLAFLGFSTAIRILRAGSVSRAIGSSFQVVRREGTSGIRHRLIATVPGFAGGPVLLEASTAGGDTQLTYADQESTTKERPGIPDQHDLSRRILVADYRIPRADVSAGERATVGILKDLCALGYEVVLVPNDMAPFPRYESELRAFGVEVVTRETGYASSRDYVAANGGSFSVLYAIRVDVAESILRVFRKVAPNARIIFHAPDLYSLRELREADVLGDAAARDRALRTRDRELAMMRLADHLVVVSPAEVPLIQAELPEVPISVFPVLYAPVTEGQPGFGKRHNIFFLGGFAHTPNVDAVLWFAAEVWPIVQAALPDVEFHILGAEAPDAVRSLQHQPGIEFVGFVEDLAPSLELFRIGVAPLRYGAGIKGKIAMTMGAGIPCVCTNVGTEGMGIEDGVHALVEDEPRPFAEAIISLYTDAEMWERLSRNGQALVRERFGDEANRAALLKVLDRARALPLSLFCDFCRNADPVPLPSPGEDQDVDVSIIVPVYNKWELTRACLTSVVQTSVGSGVRYEVILADDGSSDETVRAGVLFPGLCVIRTSSNLGFLRNCNNAAKLARGRYILLLNNDTVVLHGWLEALFQAIEADQSIAIVGSKLLYPDGYIQEAGGGLLANGDGVSIGRWLWVGGRNFPVSRREPVFNLPRETDYLSGASMLIRRSFWEGVEGFDERYAPAYCEDSDLAMSARARGMRVMYEPASEAVHFEHQSYAEEESADHKELQSRNKQRLIEKWGEELRREHLPAGSGWHLVAAHGERRLPPEVAARRKGGKLHVLYFSPFPSHPSSHGNQATIQQFARRFQSLGHKVHFALLKSGMYSAQDEQAMREAWDTLDILPNTHPLGADGNPIPFDGWYEAGLGERIRVLCAKFDIDIVFCSYVFQSKLLEFVPPYILKVIDTHDKMGDRYEMLRRNGQPLEFFSCTPQEEGEYLRRADVVVARRGEEARYFDSVSDRNTAIVIPYVEDPHFVDKEYKALSRVGLVASANRINLAIVREFLETIDHHREGRACPFTVHVAGQVKDMIPSLAHEQAAVFGESWVHLHGFVPDIGAFYSDMDCIVSPVTMGTGINVKTVQAMAYGVPLLTTAWGSKGIETDEPMHNHPDLDSLAASLLVLAEKPTELNQLAVVSRNRYRHFFDESISGMEEMFRHPKLSVPAAEKQVRQAGSCDGEKSLTIPRAASVNSVVGHKILVGTHHKTGTVWLQQIFRKIANRFDLRYIVTGHEAPEPVGDWDIFHNMHSQFDLDAAGDFRGLHMIRDPRDLIVSATHYHMKSGESWLHKPRPGFEGLSYQQKINSLPTLEDQLLFEMRNAALLDINHMRFFDYSDPRFLTIKYEEYVTDHVLARFERAFRFLEFSEPAIGWCLALALRNSLFSGAVNVGGHVRSGEPKQWPKYFTPTLKAVFHELYGDVLTILGYEEGQEWKNL